MIRQIVRFALRQRVLVLGATAVVIVVGVLAFRGLAVEAFPDVEDVHVQIISQWPGHAAEEIEEESLERIDALWPHLQARHRDQCLVC